MRGPLTGPPIKIPTNLGLQCTKEDMEFRMPNFYPTFVFPKVPGRTFCPNLPKFLAFAAAPSASTPSVRNQSQEDMEFRMLLWGTLARCCSSEECAQAPPQNE